MRNVRIDNEAGAQETLFSWAQYQCAKYPELALLYHIPNGGEPKKAGSKSRRARFALASSTRRLPRAIHRA